MSASVLAIVIAVGEASNPATATLRATAQDSLGSGTSILLVETVQPTDAESLRVERELGAGVVVLLVWREAAHLHAVLRLHVANSNRWITREIGFSSQDTLEERGRTLGFAIGSIWPETEAGARSPPEARSAPEAKSAPEVKSAPEAKSPPEARSAPEGRSPVASGPSNGAAPSTLPRRSEVEPPRLVPPSEGGPVPGPSAGLAVPAEMTPFGLFRRDLGRGRDGHWRTSLRSWRRRGSRAVLGERLRGADGGERS